MPGLMLGRTPRTVLGVLVARVRSASGRHGSCPWSGDAGAGSLTPRNTRSGLDGPMPRTITPVVWGRCRPSPDRVSLGAPSDRHGGSIVASGLAGRGGEGLLPVLGAPAAGVGRVDGDDRDACRGRPSRTSRARSLPVGMPEISCRKRFLRPCFSRVFSAAKSRSSTAIALHAAGCGPSAAGG